MSKVSIGGSATGTATFDIVAPATNTNRTITLPDTSGQVSVLDLRAAQTASGTAVDFLNIPATARRVTVMFNGVSTNGTSFRLIQLGDSGGIETTGYLGSSSGGSSTFLSNALSSGFIVQANQATNLVHGSATFSHMGSNTWACIGTFSGSDSAYSLFVSGTKSLSDTLTQIRITTVNGTDTFDAGSISILVE